MRVPPYHPLGPNPIPDGNFSICLILDTIQGGIPKRSEIRTRQGFPQLSLSNFFYQNTLTFFPYGDLNIEEPPFLYYKNTLGFGKTPSFWHTHDNKSRNTPAERSVLLNSTGIDAEKHKMGSTGMLPAFIPTKTTDKARTKTLPMATLRSPLKTTIHPIHQALLRLILLRRFESKMCSIGCHLSV